MELFYPCFWLFEEGVEVDIDAPQKGVQQGEHGYIMKITKNIDNVIRRS
jgi:hypothetical protein